MLYEKLMSTWDNVEIDEYLTLLHDDYEFVQHSTGTSSNISNVDPDQMIKFMYSTKIENRRCTYENDDILVEHRFTTYPSGDREAVMFVHVKKDGLIWRTETGATQLPSKE